MNIIIDTPGIDERKIVNDIAKQGHDLHVGWNPDIYLTVDEVMQKDYYEDLIRNNALLVAREEGEIVGYLVYSIKEVSIPIMKYRKMLYIDSICVDEKCRGRGIGTRMLEYAKDLAEKSACTELSLSVCHSNASAIKIYEDFGFEQKSISYRLKI